MSENYIARLEREREELRQQVRAIREELIRMEHYYTSPKFQGHDNDYAHVRTDVLPRIANVRFMTLVDGVPSY